MITIFQVITMEGWSEIMYMINDTTNNPTTYAFFTLLIIIGSFFLLNLILAVIMRVFTQNDELEKTKRRQRKILDETRKLRKNPNIYLRPLKVDKIERSKSANNARKFSLLDVEWESQSSNKNEREEKIIQVIKAHSPDSIVPKSPLELMKLNKTFIEQTPKKV